MRRVGPDGSPVSTDEPLVLAATALEARAIRRALPRVPVLRGGIGCSRLRPGTLPAGVPVVTCGLAGALAAGLPTGTVVVPRLVARPDGSWFECDPALVESLARAARSLGREPEMGPMATAARLLTGAERSAWRRRGCRAADMETGLLDAVRVASVRVVLDTPERELDAAWGRPLAALWAPAAWRQLPWLAIEASRCARLAAAVLRAALSRRAG